MSAESLPRKLAAILYADVAGYSRLTGEDEAGTHLMLSACLDLASAMIQTHNGSVVHYAGDAILADFPTVTDSIRCATAIQARVREKNADIADDQKVQFRIGVNLGEVIVDRDDIYGDGVNVAARLESLAPPGGICISGSCYDAIGSKLPLGYEFAGEQQVKNIAKPVRVYRVLLEGEQPTRSSRITRKWRAAAVVVALVAITATAGLWWWSERPDFRPADLEQMALPLPERPSIAVLPFDNLSGDPSQDWLGEGLAENIIATLAVSPDMLVIARNSSFSYKGQSLPLRRIAEELGVRYVLEGSVQRDGDRLRITAQLADALSGHRLWAKRWDRSTDDLFSVQDEISEKLLVEMQVSLTLGEQARAWQKKLGNLESMRDFVQGRAEFSKFSVEGHYEAERIWKAFLEREPDNFFPILLMAWLHWQKVRIGISDDPASDMAAARRLVERSLAIEESPDGYVFLAAVNNYDRMHAEAIANADKAIAMRPGSADVRMLAGVAKGISGQPREGLENMLMGMRMEPDFQDWVPGSVAWRYLELGELDRARDMARFILASDTRDVRQRPKALSILAAAAMFEGNEDEAKRHVRDMLKESPGWIDTWVQALRREANQEFVERYLDALREAGLPD